MPVNIEIDVILFDIIFGQFLQFACIGWAVFISFRIVKRNARTKTPVGVWALALWIVTGCIYDLLSFVNYDYLRQQFAPLSEELFRLRFSFSVTLRLMLIVVGFGLIALKAWARLATVFFGAFTIATITWKHPFYVFENIAIMVEQNQSQELITQLQYPAFPWISMFAYVTIDIIFAGLLIYYFTQASVVSIFNHDRTTQQTSRAA